MKSGISGTVTARIAADCQSRGSDPDEDQRRRERRRGRAGAGSARSTPRARRRPGRPSPPARPPARPAGRPGARSSRWRTSRSRRPAMTRAAPWRPAASKPAATSAAGDAHGGQPPQRRRDVGQRRAVQEDARHDVREQRRLRDDERGRDQTERDRHAQMRPCRRADGGEPASRLAPSAAGGASGACGSAITFRPRAGEEVHRRAHLAEVLAPRRGDGRPSRSSPGRAGRAGRNSDRDDGHHRQRVVRRGGRR